MFVDEKDHFEKDAWKKLRKRYSTDFDMPTHSAERPTNELIFDRVRPAALTRDKMISSLAFQD